ncbi:hypothetical protein niasHS_011761 [Heterodera schachtii]|uniref:DNA-directed RNA polymerase n=1 Tax=Heterodera schachtii TaxID=97005 RepID=A0ABD2IH88_HETSC
MLHSYSCAAQLGINPKVYPDIELFNVPNENFKNFWEGCRLLPSSWGCPCAGDGMAISNFYAIRSFLIPTLLRMVLLNSCSFKPPTRRRSDRLKECVDKHSFASSKPAKPSKRAKNWPHAFFIRDLAISHFSPHGFEGEKTGLCKMLCVHEQLLQYYDLHEFECFHFPTYELPLKLPPRPWLDMGHCGPAYTYAQNVVRKLEPYPDMDPTEMMRLHVGDRHSRARPVFDALNLLGATPWIINKEMLCHMRRTLEMSYDGRHREHLRLRRAVQTKGRVGTRGADGGGVGRSDCGRTGGRDDRIARCGKWRRKRKKRKSEENAEEQTTTERGQTNLLSLPAEGAEFERLPPDKCEQNSLHCWLVYRLTLAQHLPTLYSIFRITSFSMAVPTQSFRNQPHGRQPQPGPSQICRRQNPPLIYGPERRGNGRDSEEPWQTLAACIELRDALSRDRPEDFDGSCNGLQHYAAMERDLLGAREVNLLPDELPRDLYSNVAIRVEEMRLEDEKDEQSKWHQVATDLRKEMEGQGKDIFRSLFDALCVRKPHASIHKFNALMEWFKRCAQQTLKLGRPMEWVLSSGCPWCSRTLRWTRRAPALCFGPFPHKQVNAFPPNFVHSLDSSHMMLTALHCYRHSITYASVHDCFWTHECRFFMISSSLCMNSRLLTMSNSPGFSLQHFYHPNCAN